MAAADTAPRRDAAGLAGICLSRFLTALVFTSYYAVLPVLQREWGMSGAEAGRIACTLGYEMDEGTIPQEAGINERAVSFTKGCYVGQETIARLHYRGKPNRYLAGLRLSQPCERDQEIYLGDRRVGKIEQWEAASDTWHAYKGAQTK